MMSRYSVGVCPSVGLCYLLLAPKWIKVKAKVNLSLCTSCRYTLWNGGIVPLIHNLVTVAERPASPSGRFTSAEISPGTHRRAGLLGPELIWVLWRRGTMSCLCRESNRDCSDFSMGDCH